MVGSGTIAAQSPCRIAEVGLSEIRVYQVGEGLEEKEKMALHQPLKEELELTAKESEKGVYGRGISVSAGSDIQPPITHSPEH